MSINNEQVYYLLKLVLQKFLKAFLYIKKHTIKPYYPSNRRMGHPYFNFLALQGTLYLQSPLINLYIFYLKAYQNSCR